MYTKRDEFCAYRKAAAIEILTGKAMNIQGKPEANAVKMGVQFKADLELARDHGTLTVVLHSFISSIRKVWRTDTQSEEGDSRMLQYYMEAAPATKHPHLASTFEVRKTLCVEARQYIEE